MTPEQPIADPTPHAGTDAGQETDAEQMRDSVRAVLSVGAGVASAALSAAVLAVCAVALFGGGLLVVPAAWSAGARAVLVDGAIGVAGVLALAGVGAFLARRNGPTLRASRTLWLLAASAWLLFLVAFGR